MHVTGGYVLGQLARDLCPTRAQLAALYYSQTLVFSSLSFFFCCAQLSSTLYYSQTLVGGGTAAGAGSAAGAAGAGAAAAASASAAAAAVAQDTCGGGANRCLRAIGMLHHFSVFCSRSFVCVMRRRSSTRIYNSTSTPCASSPPPGSGRFLNPKP